MKKLNLIIASLFLFAVASAQVKTDLQKENLKKGVKQVKETSYTVVMKNGIAVEDKVKEVVITDYNDWGNRQRVIFETDSINYSYDSNNRLIEEDEFSAGEQFSKIAYTYDGKGNCAETITLFLEDSSREKSFFEYDKKGNQINDKSYKKSGRLYVEFIREFDEDGNNTRWDCYGADGKLMKATVFFYDKKNLLIGYDDYNNSLIKTDQYTFSYEYNANKNWVKKIASKNTVPYQIWVREIQ